MKGEDQVATLALISFHSPLWIEELKSTYSLSQPVMEIYSKLQNGETSDKHYTLQQGLLLRKGKIVIVPSCPFKENFLHFIHNISQVGHVGYHKTLHRAILNFYWEWMRADIKKVMKECDICQVAKYETLHPIGLLQPLPIPVQPWTDVLIDFAEGLHQSHSSSIILSVIDRLTMYSQFFFFYIISSLHNCECGTSLH